MNEKTAKRQGRKEKKLVAPDISAAGLREAALRYLARYAASTDMLRRVLQRRGYRAARLADKDIEFNAPDFTAQIERVIADMAAMGLLNDAQFAEQKARQLRHAGKSAQFIQGKLALKGIARKMSLDADAAAALDMGHEDSAAAELAAAERLAQKKKLGRYRPQMPEEAAERAKQRQRDMAFLLRAGFSLDVARRALAEKA